jgi:ElaB/YqjD/DUF883 family membrane-anchored ribosome-binding protein
MSTDTDLRSGTKKAAGAAGASQMESSELADHVAAIREELQAMKSTIASVANRQMGKAQNAAMEKANEAEEAIRNNPLQAVAIAAGLGFLFGVFTRR